MKPRVTVTGTGVFGGKIAAAIQDKMNEPTMKSTKQKDQKIETIEAKHEFTEPEKVSLGRQLADINRAIEDLGARKLAINSDFKAQIDQKQAEAGMVSTKVINGYEMRPTRCTLTFDTKNRTKTYRREDSGDFVESKEMTPSDWELHFPGMEQE